MNASKRSRLLLKLAVGEGSIESNTPSTSKVTILSDVFISNAYDPTSKKESFYGTDDCQSDGCYLVSREPSPFKYFEEATNVEHCGNQIHVLTCENLDVLELTSIPTPRSSNSNRIVETGCNSHGLFERPKELILDAETGILKPVVVTEIVDYTNYYLDEVSGLLLPNEPPEVLPVNFGIESNDSETSEAENISKNRNKNKIKRVLGHQYNSRKRKRVEDDNNNSNFYYELHTGRSIREKPCLHSATAKSDRSFLCGLISEDTRKSVFKYFWSLGSWEAKKAYLKNLIRMRQVIRRRKESVSENQHKNLAFDYFIPDAENIPIRVCKDFMLKTFDLQAETVTEWVKTLQTEQPAAEEQDLRTRHQKRTSTTVATVSNNAEKQQSVKEWLDLLPKVCSHYCRAYTNRVYVEDTFESKAHMHRIYLIWCQDNTKPKASKRVFYMVLDVEKISIYKPRKDQCDVCVSYKEGHTSEEVYQLHILKKNEAKIAKSDAINLTIFSDILVITMDVQSVLLCPKILVSVQYYKQKLQMHNFSIYLNNTQDVQLYVWHEANGGVTSNEFTSCIIDFLKKQTAYKKFILISDGCSYQNRNKVLASSLANLSKTQNVEIEQIILEKGHTMMEVDSVHSTLEKKFRPPIYAPIDYVNKMKEARPSHPYKVIYLDYTFFKDYEKVCNYDSIRPGKRAGDPTVNDIRALQYKDGEIYYKLRQPDEWKKLPQRVRTNNNILASLYTEPRKIDGTKFENLQSLKQYMHSDYHSFYDSLSF